MATYTKFNSFVADICQKKIDLTLSTGDTLRVLLANAAFNAADTIVDTTTTPCTVKSTSNTQEIAAAGTGYAKKGPSITTTTSSQSSGTYTLAANQVVVTADASTGPFQYVCLYSDSGGTTATRPVIASWNYGSAVTLASGDTFTIKFNNANPGTIFTLA